MPKSYPFTPPTREELLVIQYGECVKKVDAARLLSCSFGTIQAMIQDGRLEAVCEGKKVSVRSIAHYMDAPGTENFKARLRRKGKNPSKYIVPSRMTAP